MPNENIPDDRRLRTTKAIARRLDSGYLTRTARLTWKTRLILAVLALAVIVAITLTVGSGSTRTLLSPGPLSPPHALLANRCEGCHASAFSSIPDSACAKCHDLSTHPAKAVDQARIQSTPPCRQCHQEHRGEIRLVAVGNENCTGCHRDLKAHASGVKLAGTQIAGFTPQTHPEFSSAARSDLRPLKLNHAIHMPGKTRVIRKITLPMQCPDCHKIVRNPSGVDLAPVTFEQNCKSCHARELEFDVYRLLPTSTPAPHTHDPRTIRQFIVSTYQKLLEKDPRIVSRPLTNELTAQPNAAAWMKKVVAASEAYLLQSRDGKGGRDGKCTYCHEFAGRDGDVPIVAKVNTIQGRFEKDKPEGEPWLLRGEFSHRVHRSVQCESCHLKARSSTKTSDVLIPGMAACLPCHADGKVAGLDRCSECHQYHNKGQGK